MQVQIILTIHACITLHCIYMFMSITLHCIIPTSIHAPMYKCIKYMYDYICLYIDDIYLFIQMIDIQITQYKVLIVSWKQIHYIDETSGFSLLKPHHVMHRLLVLSQWGLENLPILVAYIRSYIHPYIHTYIHTYMPTYLHTYIHTYLPTYIHTFIQF